MKKLLYIAVLAIGMIASAQTNTIINTTYTTIGTAGSQTFVNGSKFEVNTDFTNIKNGQYTNITSRGVVINNEGTITNITRTGISTAGSVTAAQIFTGGMNVGNEITNLKTSNSLKANATDVVNLTNKVNKNASVIGILQDVKADKTQVKTDIATAKSEAIAQSNSYTDQKTDDLKKDLTLYTDNSVKESESRLNKRIDAVELRLDNRITAETTRAMSAEKAITNEMRGLGAISAAMSAAQGSQLYNPQKRGNISIGTGYYNGATAISGGASYFTSSNTKINMNVASGTYTKLAVGVGASFGF